MKKFFTVIPLQQRGNLDEYVYEAVGNQMLSMEHATHFPIMTAISGYVEKGEEFRVIAVMSDDDSCRRNLLILTEEIEAFCAKTGASCPKGVEVIETAVDDQVSAHLGTFQKLIDFTEDDDELFACMTYGTKPTSQVLMMAVQYAYRVKRNASITCIVYGQIDRSVQPAKGRVYDMTALIQMDEIVRVLADKKVQNPGAIIGNLLSV